MTLAMNNIMLGATLVYTGGTPSGGNSPFVRTLATGSIGGVPWMVLVWAAVDRHRHRRHPLFALGPPAAGGRREPARQLSQRHRQRPAW